MGPEAPLAAAVEKVKREMRGNPTAGDVVPGGSGLRKVRMAGGGRGKSGGYRIVYALFVSRTVAVLFTGYAKNEKEDLTADELKSIVAVLPEAEQAAILLAARNEGNQNGEE